MSQLLQDIRALCVLPGVSGDEGAVRDYILAQAKPHATRCEVDALGNVLVFKKGRQPPKNTLLFSAHMDEVGFIVTYVEESGFLRFAPVGGIDPRVAVGKPVRVGKAGHYGLIGTKAIHQQSEKEKETPPKFDALTIDIGAKTREQALERVRPGDRAVFQSEFLEFGAGRLLSRALDDRAGCALLLDLLRGDLAYDCHFSFTVLEETGCTGGATAGYAVNPDIAVVVETTTAGDIAGVEDSKTVCKLGDGPVLSFMDRGTVYDHALYHHALDLAQAQGIRCQSKAGVFGGNESRALQTARGGARTLAVSLPCRYLHSPSCVVQSSDVDETARLLPALVASLGPWEGR